MQMHQDLQHKYFKSAYTNTLRLALCANLEHVSKNKFTLFTFHQFLMCHIPQKGQREFLIQVTYENFSLLVFNICLTQVHSYQYSEVHIDSNLSWNVHVTTVCNKTQQ